MSIYFENEQRYTTAINSSDLSNNIDTVLKDKIISEIEGRCVNDGYIKKDSVRLIKRSIGKLMMSQFNGNIIYNIIYTAKVCNPHEGDIVKCRVENINKMGIMAYIDDDDSPMSILLAKQHHQDNESFSKLQEKDEIYIKIIGKRFEFGDNKISVIGILNEPILPKAKDVKETTNEMKLETIVYSNRSKPFKWLSNFHIAQPFTYKDRTYISLEHAFNSTKNSDDDFKDLFTMNTDTYIGDLPNLAKKTGNKTNMKKMNKKLYEQWEENKLETMEGIMIDYFNQNKELKEKIINTGDKLLVYRDTDKFWGLDKNDTGENNHGKLLMKLRGEFNK